MSGPVSLPPARASPASCRLARPLLFCGWTSAVRTSLRGAAQGSRRPITDVKE